MNNFNIKYKNNIIWDEITEIEYIDPDSYPDSEYVYDFSVDNVHTFTTADNLVVHNTLNTFHYAGVSSKTNVTQGVPRLKELLNSSKKPKTPSLTIYLPQNNNLDINNNSDIIEIPKKTLNKLRFTNLLHVVKETSIYYDPDPKNTIITEDKQFVKDYYNIYDDDINFTTLSKWVLRIELDHQSMLDKNLKMNDIYISIYNKYKNKKIHIIYSDDNSPNLVFHIRFLQEITNESNSFIIYKPLLSLEQSIINDTNISGIEKIKDILVRKIDTSFYDEISDTIIKKQEYVLDTIGTNLKDVICLNYIDKTKIISNVVHEVLDVLGIEAARQVLFDEINSVIQNNGIYINYRHIDLLVDLMTNKGNIMSIDRHGVNKSECGPLAKSSFEETDDQLIKAGVFSQSDDRQSITFNLILGQKGKFGTGMPDLIFDSDCMNDNL